MIYPPSFLAYCQSKSIRLTSLRKTILYLLWQEKQPLKAYEILDRLLAIEQYSTPPSVYRVLDYFVDLGIVHKIESIQSYTLCHEPEKHQPSELFMVCNRCHHVQELNHIREIRTLIQQIAETHQFQLGHEVIELRGRCQTCQASSS